MATGPSGPRIEREQNLILPAGKYLRSKGTHLRKWGPGGNDCERPLREGAHRKRPPAAFWLLCRRGQSNNVFLGGQRPPLQMIEISPTPRRAEPQKQSEALQKVLLPTILTRKVGALVPGLGRERLKTLRGATQFQNSGAVPFDPRGAAGRPRLSPGPLLALSWPVPVPRGPFSRGALLCPAVFRLLMRRHGGEQSYAIPLLR